MHPCTGGLTEGGEVLEGEGLEVGVVLDGVVLVEPVRLLQQEQDPLGRLQLTSSSLGTFRMNRLQR